MLQSVTRRWLFLGEASLNCLFAPKSSFDGGSCNQFFKFHQTWTSKNNWHQSATQVRKTRRWWKRAFGLGDANVSHCKTEKQGDQQPNALKSPLASHLQRSQLNQFANPTHMQEPKRNENPSNVLACNLPNALLGCSTESRAQNHIDQRMPCLMPDWICGAGCDVPWTDDESETELQ